MEGIPVFQKYEAPYPLYLMFQQPEQEKKNTARLYGPFSQVFPKQLHTHAHAEQLSQQWLRLDPAGPALPTEAARPGQVNLLQVRGLLLLPQAPPLSTHT